MGISGTDFTVLFPAFTCVAILLSTTRGISPKCKLEHVNSVLKCCLGYLEPSDHMAFEVPVPFLQASLSHTLCTMLVLAYSNFPGGCSLHSVKAWPNALILHVIHCPCLLVPLVIVTITFSMKFHNCKGHAYFLFGFEARRIMHTFIVMWVTWRRVSCRAHTLISCGLLRVGTVFMSQLCDPRTEQSFWFYWLNNIMLP